MKDTETRKNKSTKRANIETTAAAYITAKGSREATETAYKKAVALWLSMIRVSDMRNATTDHAGTFAAKLTAKYGTTGTAKYYYNLIRALFAYAYESCLIDSNPLAMVNPHLKGQKVKTGAGRAVALSAVEVARLKETECPDIITKRAFLFSLLTGLRISDIETLRRADIQTEPDGTTYVCKETRKTGAKIVIPLHREAVALLGAGTTGNVLFFPFDTYTTGKNKGKTNRVKIDRALKSWAEAAGIDRPLSFHVARHTFCTNVYNQTGDIYVTQQLAGHTSIETTTRYYAEVNRGTLRKAINSLAF